MYNFFIYQHSSEHSSSKQRIETTSSNSVTKLAGSSDNLRPKSLPIASKPVSSKSEKSPNVNKLASPDVDLVPSSYLKNIDAKPSEKDSKSSFSRGKESNSVKDSNSVRDSNNVKNSNNINNVKDSNNLKDSNNVKDANNVKDLNTKHSVDSEEKHHKKPKHKKHKHEKHERKRRMSDSDDEICPPKNAKQDSNHKIKESETVRSLDDRRSESVEREKMCAVNAKSKESSEKKNENDIKLEQKEAPNGNSKKEKSENKVKADDSKSYKIKQDVTMDSKTAGSEIKEKTIYKEKSDISLKDEKFKSSGHTEKSEKGSKKQESNALGIKSIDGRDSKDKLNSKEKTPLRISELKNESGEEKLKDKQLTYDNLKVKKEEISDSKREKDAKLDNGSKKKDDTAGGTKAAEARLKSLHNSENLEKSLKSKNDDDKAKKKLDATLSTEKSVTSEKSSSSEKSAKTDVKSSMDGFSEKHYKKKDQKQKSEIKTESTNANTVIADKNNSEFNSKETASVKSAAIPDKYISEISIKETGSVKNAAVSDKYSNELINKETVLAKSTDSDNDDRKKKKKKKHKHKEDSKERDEELKPKVRLVETPTFPDILTAGKVTEEFQTFDEFIPPAVTEETLPLSFIDSCMSQTENAVNETYLSDHEEKNMVWEPEGSNSPVNKTFMQNLRALSSLSDDILSQEKVDDIAGSMSEIVQTWGDTFPMKADGQLLSQPELWQRSRLSQSDFSSPEGSHNQTSADPELQCMSNPPLLPITDFPSHLIAPPSDIGLRQNSMHEGPHADFSSLEYNELLLNPGTDLSDMTDFDGEAPNGEKFSALVELQKAIMTSNDRNLLWRIIDLIKRTGMFRLSSNGQMFDFDLCRLDLNTVNLLRNYIRSIS